MLPTSPLAAPVMVTVCGWSKLSGVKVKDAGETVPPFVASLVLSAMVTSAEGWAILSEMSSLVVVSLCKGFEKVRAPGPRPAQPESREM